MGAHYEETAEGNFRITYDDPENEDPLHGGERGEAFPCHYDNETAVRQAIIHAVADANDKLPPGTIFEIRTKYPVSENGIKYDFGRKVFTREQLAEDFGVAWYSLSSKASNFQEQALTGLRLDYKNVEPCNLCGYVKLGTLKTPEKQGG